MEIGHNFDVNAVNRALAARSSPVERPAAQGRPSFENTEALDQALRNEAQTRPGVVTHAKHYIGDVTYPPSETIAKIAHLLAIHFDDPID
jgi:hypothetical protein